MEEKQFMNLRDLFAANVMVGLTIANKSRLDHMIKDDVAFCYRVADEMIKYKEKTNG